MARLVERDTNDPLLNPFDDDDKHNSNNDDQQQSQPNAVLKSTLPKKEKEKKNCNLFDEVVDANKMAQNENKKLQESMAKREDFFEHRVDENKLA